MQKNREAVKKLDNVKKDHQKRIEELKQSQVNMKMYFLILNPQTKIKQK